MSTSNLESSNKLGAKAVELTKASTSGLESKRSPKFGSASPTKKVPEKEKGSKFIFGLFLMANLLINFDGGVIPASLVQIENELHITYTEEAALGSLVYVGLSAASLFVSPTFQRFQAKNILGFMLLLKAIFCGLFSIYSNMVLLYSLRLLMGITQAFCVIYAPVWVNEFSPKDRSTTWMGTLHAFVPIGIMVGFVFAAAIANYFTGILSWRFAFQVQAVGELPIALCFFFQDNKKIDVLADQKESFSTAKKEMKAPSPINNSQKVVRIDTINYNEVKSFVQQAKMILGNRTLILTSVSLCSLFYVVTGIQYWSSLYMIKILQISPKYAMISFGFIAITAPLAGVFVGGLTSDSMGGYRGNNLLTAVKLCCAYSIIAFLISMPLNSVNKPWFFGSLLWFVLFFGACIMPTATGIIVDCVPREYQAANSSFSQLLYNIFGYFMAPVLSALIMDRFTDQEAGLIWGFRSVLWFSIFGVIFMLLNWYQVARRMENYNEMVEQLESQAQSLSKAEIKSEIARRRAVSFL